MKFPESTLTVRCTGSMSSRALLSVRGSDKLLAALDTDLRGLLAAWFDIGFLELHRIDCNASHGGLDLYEFVAEKLRTTPPEEIRPEPLMTGADLIAMGYAPGPRFKEILSAVEDAQLEGKVQGRDDAAQWVKAEFPQVR